MSGKRIMQPEDKDFVRYTQLALNKLFLAKSISNELFERMSAGLRKYTQDNFIQNSEVEDEIVKALSTWVDSVDAE